MLIPVDCVCGGINLSCIKCNGSGTQVKVACARCNGTGSDSGIKNIGGKCVNCRGQGWRDMDQFTIGGEPR